MRLHNHLHILATAATVAAVAPAAHAEAISNGGGGSGPAPVHVLAASPRSASTDWELIALAGGAGVLLIGAGVAGSRQITRRRASADQVRAPHVA
jgi:hypothetical protein